MGSDLTYDAFEAAVTFNSTDNEYLVVWRGDDNTGGLIDGEFEIFGQRIDAATGAELGVDFRISAMGPDMDADYDAFSPAAAYNPTNNQYLVVWRGDDTAGNLIDEEFEIFGQRLEGDTGVPIGGPFRISTMGTDGEADFGPFNPAVAYNGTDNEYMVAWNADDNSGSLVDGEAEIFGQRLDAATGMPIGDLVRLSAMGPDGDPRYAALDPAAAYNSLAGEVLVVWRGDDDRGALVDDEYEIFGQRYKSLVEIHLPIIRRDN